ncbi:phage T7 F exclusion suppressor FxsA [Streptomyces jeddahensis]|uniref:Phage T7 F exclusion suppressor FxsA n=2 Tax=Streptomyces jeddahensis TaxID=1716141 RepID=A0A177HKU6_9ACTN|nr:phage T7 F exclusion suppressor FxsA [Streptomyces jeddahensis]
MTGATPSTNPARPRRSRPRSFLPLGIAAWLVLEIWLLTVVADTAGGFTVFLLLIGGIVLGSVLIKRAGRRAFRRLSEALQQQQTAAVPAADRRGSGNALTMLGGLLLIMPGLISDVVGLLCLVPPVQKVLSRYAERTFERRLGAAAPGSFGDAFQQARIRRPDGKVVQGEVIRDDTPPASRPDADPRPPLTP